MGVLYLHTVCYFHRDMASVRTADILFVIALHVHVYLEAGTYSLVSIKQLLKL